MSSIRLFYPSILRGSERSTSSFEWKVSNANLHLYFIHDFFSCCRSIFVEKLRRALNVSAGKKKLLSPRAEMVEPILVAGNGMGRRDFSHGGNQYPLLRVFFHAPISSQSIHRIGRSPDAASTAITFTRVNYRLVTRIELISIPLLVIPPRPTVLPPPDVNHRSHR